MAARQRDFFVAAGSDRTGSARRRAIEWLLRPCLGFRRRALGSGGGDRSGRARSRAQRRAVFAFRIARQWRLWPPRAVRHAQAVRRPCGKTEKREGQVNAARSSASPTRPARAHRRPAGGEPRRTASDALVLFGMTGDLAHKKIFPALYAM